jgi:hypothetical protein
MTIASMAMAVGGAVKKGQAAESQKEAMGLTTRGNIAAYDRAATDAFTRAMLPAANAAMRGGQMVGAQDAAFAATGVSANSGSALDVKAQTQMFSRMDVMAIQGAAAREALGYQQRSQAAGTEFAGASAALDNQRDAAYMEGMTQAGMAGSKGILGMRGMEAGPPMLSRAPGKSGVNEATLGPSDAQLAVAPPIRARDLSAGFGAFNTLPGRRVALPGGGFAGGDGSAGLEEDALLWNVINRGYR